MTNKMPEQDLLTILPRKAQIVKLSTLEQAQELKFINIEELQSDSYKIYQNAYGARTDENQKVIAVQIIRQI